MMTLTRMPLWTARLTSSATRHQRGRPCIAGDLKSGVISILTFVDDEDCDAWLPQLRALCLAIEGKIDNVTVGPPL
jgi:hypothetical protein